MGSMILKILIHEKQRDVIFIKENEKKTLILVGKPRTKNINEILTNPRRWEALRMLLGFSSHFLLAGSLLKTKLVSAV